MYLGYIPFLCNHTKTEINFCRYSQSYYNYSVIRKNY